MGEGIEISVRNADIFLYDDGSFVYNRGKIQ